MPKGRQRVDRLASAQANGYVRGANRGKDQNYCEIFYSDRSKSLQEQVLSVYVLWASQEDETLREEGLREGLPVPDLATIKDFIRFYIFSSNGMISLRPTKSSVLNFAERFFAGFTRLTKSTFDARDTTDVYQVWRPIIELLPTDAKCEKWISKGLVQDEVIEDIRRAKYMFTHCDLTNILVSLWNDDDPIFIHPRYRVQLTFAILIYCYTGARIGTFIPDTSKKDERGLRYEDIELYIYRRMDGEIELFFRLSEKWVKNNDNPKNTVFRIAMREHGKLRFNPVPWLLEMAVQDGAFLHFDSLKTLETWNPDNNEPVPLLWKPSVAEEPVLRQVTRFHGISKHAWTRESFCRIFRAVVINAGYPEIITIHTLRRGLANRLDKVATDSERSQILTQKDPNVFGRSYIDSTSALNTMDAFLGDKMRLDHVEYLRGVGRYRALGYPRRLPAERQHTITKNADLRELERRLEVLRNQGTSSESNYQSTVDESSVENVDDDASFAIKLIPKQIKVLKTRLYNSELAKYREEWVQTRVEAQVRAGGKTPETIVYNDVAHCLFKAQPDRQRLAELMPKDDHLSYQDMLSVVASLLAYCTKDYDVFYRPGEEPVNGSCPVGNCNLTSLTRPMRSNHIQDCQRQERCRLLGCEETQLKYCYECFSFLNIEEWKDHCSWHLEQGMSRRCEIITYCYTLVRPGYCPFCLGSEILSPPDRMRAWKRSNELRSHVVSHINTMCRTYICSHPMCQVSFDSELQLRYHLSDTHGLQKAIWDTSENELGSQKKSSTQANGVLRGKKRSQEWKGAKKRQRLGSGEAGKLHVIQWSPDSSTASTSACRYSTNIEKQSDGSSPVEDNYTGHIPLQLARHNHPVSSDHLATPFRQFSPPPFSSADRRLGDMLENKPGSNTLGIECSARSPSPQPDPSSVNIDTSNPSTLYTGDEFGLSSTTVTSSETPLIDPRLLQDCNLSSFNRHESETPEDQKLSGPDPTTPPTLSVPNNESLSPGGALSGTSTTTSLASVNCETPMLTATFQKEVPGNPKCRSITNNGVPATDRLTRAMARRTATEAQCCDISSPRRKKSANHLSKEEDSLLTSMAKAGLSLQETIQKFQNRFPNRSQALIQSQWYMMQPSARITRSASGISMRRSKLVGGLTLQTRHTSRSIRSQ